jgi:hypothetical protein
MTAISPTTPEGYLQGQVFPPTFELVRHIISFLKWRFSTLPAGAYQWKPEAESSPDQAGAEIFISADTPIKPQVVGKRPAITVLRSGAAFQGVGIGDLAYVDLQTGAQVRMDLIPTNLMINVLSRMPVEAESLAWFIQEQIFTFREEIVKSMPQLLYTGARASISAPSPAGALVESTDFEWCVVVISLPAYLQHSTSKLPLNKKIVSGVSVSGATTPAGSTGTSPAASATPSANTSPASGGTNVALLQGTAVAQPVQTAASRNAAVPPSIVSGGFTSGGGGLPQNDQNEAQYSQPLTVNIETK